MEWHFALVFGHMTCFIIIVMRVEGTVKNVRLIEGVGMEQNREELYKQGRIPYCGYCVETDDWDNHDSHALYYEMDAEQRNNAHNVNIGNVGYCLTCGSTDSTNGICGKTTG